MNTVVKPSEIIENSFHNILMVVSEFGSIQCVGYNSLELIPQRVGHKLLDVHH